MSFRELSVLVDEEAFKQLERLKAKLTKLDNSQLIAFALRCLEQRTDTIIKRRALERIKALKNEGLSPRQIADHLNKKAMPTLGEANRWRADIVRSLLKETDRQQGEF
jgi:hypothetical protein